MYTATQYTKHQSVVHMDITFVSLGYLPRYLSWPLPVHYRSEFLKQEVGTWSESQHEPAGRGRQSDYDRDRPRSLNFDTRS